MDNDKIYVALNDNVFVKEIKQETMQGSMIMPDSLDNDFVYGEVISTCDCYFDHGVYVSSVVSPGDIVAFPKIAGVKVTLNGMQLIRIKQADLVAKQVNGIIEN